MNNIEQLASFLSEFLLQIFIKLGFISMFSKILCQSKSLGTILFYFNEAVPDCVTGEVLSPGLILDDVKLMWFNFER